MINIDKDKSSYNINDLDKNLKKFIPNFLLNIFRFLMLVMHVPLYDNIRNYSPLFMP